MSDLRRKHDSPRCYRCKWLFHRTPEQENRVFCLACTSRVRAEWTARTTPSGEMLPWHQLAEFVAPIVADLGAREPAKPRYPGGIDDMEF